MTGRIIYSSRARRGLINLMEFATILGEARHKNARLGLTGVLIGSGSHFLQAIEGPPENIGHLFERIVRDPRHVNVQLVERVQTPIRLFSGASMSGVILSPSLEPRMTAIMTSAQPSPDDCLSLLKQALVGLDPDRAMST